MDKLKGYLVWLNWLLALGANLKPLLDLITEFYGKLKPLLPALPTPDSPGDDGGLAITQQITCDPITNDSQELVADVLSAESEVANLVAGPNAVFDGSRLRAIYEMWQVLQALFTAFKALSG